MMRAHLMGRNRSFFDHLHKRGPRDAQNSRSSGGGHNVGHRADRDRTPARHHTEHLLQQTADLGRHSVGAVAIAFDREHTLRTLQLLKNIFSQARLMTRYQDAAGTGLHGGHDDRLRS